MPERKHIYFASDFHFGTPNNAASRIREDAVIRWLDEISVNAAEIYLVGDVFDFWFEYKHAVPRGFSRFLGKIAALVDSGIKVTFFKGNHDMWMFDYFPEELGVTVVSDELVITRNGKKFYIHHGDGLGPGDTRYKILKKIFRSGFCQWLFARIHPNLGIAIATKWSRKSRASQLPKHTAYFGDDYEWLAIYSRELLKKEHFDYFIFGHRHLPIDLSISGSRYINLGEWLNCRSYAVFDGETVTLKYFEPSPVQ
ncbi:UDP-2,3-diacylglucosamine diphosphatase [Hufsiella ginkgonis]|uniref:UDP-2,3-diacylglucosamine diphosphatase n=1 Tax=Hufsiella ginkgonis TaxID=2695274 RepID=A0A7K1XTQ3_9SPHI|nr:UDP-2,3-diacylglucosamine diphosphatase [Hufsiella ginkgonis]MXV14198.1 UDP-2,3-diacylglucosamine diphosphatase [Hufsiella ginkgonis]